MRIAVCGTHCCGKSTIIEEFLLTHPDFTHEPEPYRVLEEDYGEVFDAEPSPDDFYRQLEFIAGRLRCYQRGERVIFERSPVDFLAYLLAITDLGRRGGAGYVIDRSIAMVREAIQLLDLIVFLPLNDSGSDTGDEDPELRWAVNSRLEDIFNNDDFNLFTSDRPLTLQATGSTAQRLRMLERAVELSLADDKTG